MLAPCIDPHWVGVSVLTSPQGRVGSMKATKKAIASVLAALLFSHIALAESWLTLDPSQYPDEVRQLLDQSRSYCKEAGAEVVDYPQAGVTIVDLNRDGSKDIILEAWRACA